MLIFSYSSCKNKPVQNSKIAINLEKNTKTPLIGFSIDTLAIERWRRDLDTFLNTAKGLGAQVIVQNSGNSIKEQNRQILYLVDKGVKVIVIVAKKEDSLSSSIKKAQSKGIPVIAYDRLITNSDISLYMTIDSRKVGEYMAKALLKEKPSGKWFCILGPQEDHNMTFIKKGVDKILKNTSVHISLTYYTEGWNYDISYQKMAEKLKQGDIPDAVLCGNDAVANSIIKAISESNLHTYIAIAGQDADIAACQNIVQGKQLMTVYKPITKLAQMAAEYAYKLAKGQTIAEIVQSKDTINNGFSNIPVIWLNPVMVTKNNIDEIVVRSGFHTYGEVYYNK